MTGKTSGNSLERTVIDTNSAEYECRGRRITLEIEIARRDEKPIPVIELDGRVWIDGELEPEARIYSQGEWMARPVLPQNHPLVKDSEPTGGYEIDIGGGEVATVGQRPANILDVPDEFYDAVFHSYVDAQRALDGEIHSSLEGLSCEIEMHGKLVDGQTGTIHAEATVKSDVGEYRVHYSMQSDGVVGYEFYHPERISNRHIDTVRAAASVLAPISHDDFVEDVIMSSSTEELDNCDGDKLKPICQASDCEEFAVMEIPSPDGHPDDEWKLCDEHAADADYKDPYRNMQTEWTLEKLYYLNADGERVSHNTL